MEENHQPSKFPNMSFLDTLKLLSSLLFLLAMPIALGLVIRDEYLQKHTKFPSYSYHPFSEPPTRWESFEGVSAYLSTNKQDVVDQDFHLSDAPIWRRPCDEKEEAVRVLASVIRADNGQSSDITMYFCVASNRDVHPANPEARFYTRH